MDKNKKIIIVLMILIIVFTIMGGTLAYWSWRTTDEEKTNVTFTLESDFSCSVSGGGNINPGEKVLIPTLVSDEYADNYIKRTVTVSPTINTEGKTIYMDLWLDIKTLGIGLSNTDYFRYSFTTGSSSPDDGVVYSGNFRGLVKNNRVKLLLDKEYTSTTTETYYLWIWVDVAETNSDTMNQSFSLSINGNCTDTKTEPNAPVLDDGLIPIVFDTSDGTVIKTVSSSDTSWYDYSRQEWANAVLVKESGTQTRAYYKANPNVSIDESDILAYYVWIPRYSYKIWTTGTSGNGQEQTIEIKFESTDSISTGSAIGQYITHPAFWWDNNSNGVRDPGEELSGIWVGKFETGGTATAPLIKPDIYSLKSQTVSEEFTTAQIFGTSTYGMTSNIDAHMMKNSEWGAVAYLSHSKYGVNREIYINNSSGYYTGRSGGNIGGSTAINTVYTSQTSTTQYKTYGFYTWDGYLLEYDTNTKSSTHDISKVASTTGNITGVYDMSGGAYEYVMGYYSPASTTWGATSSSNYAGFTSQPDSKYYDNYTTTSALTACNGGICYGHSLSETSNWYGDLAGFVWGSYPWFLRGGIFGNGSDAGAFDFNLNNGDANGNFAARSVLLAGS